MELARLALLVATANHREDMASLLRVATVVPSRRTAAMEAVVMSSMVAVVAAMEVELRRRTLGGGRWRLVL